jgi:predicted HAD superfamily phosphohydrolase YqeG
MAGPKLDGAGIEKLKTLEKAQGQLQRVHGFVEHMAVAARAQQPVSTFASQVRRAAFPMVQLLKTQFGMIADQVNALLMTAARTGSDQIRVRSLREQVAQIRAQLEIAVTKTMELHTHKDEHDEVGA